MSNFWAKALGAAPPAQPSAPPQQQTSAPWWASPTPPVPAPRQTVPQGYEHPQQHDEEEPQNVSEALRSNRVPKKALVLRESNTCPECGSADYFRSPEHPRAVRQCQGCGYNERFFQQVAGTPSGQGEAATPTKQTATGGARGRSNYNPHILINKDRTS